MNTGNWDCERAPGTTEIVESGYTFRPMDFSSYRFRNINENILKQTDAVKGGRKVLDIYKFYR